MFTTLDRNLMRTSFRAALITSSSNLLVVFGLFLLYSQSVAWLWPWVLAVLLILTTAVITDFYVALKAARLTGRAGTGVAASCLTGLISGLITTVVVIGVYSVFFAIPALLEDHYRSGDDVFFCLFMGLLLLVICGVVFIFFQGLCCGLLSGEVGGKFGEECWADEVVSEECASS